MDQTNVLPDPFTFLNGTAVDSAAAWSCRAAQIKSLFQRYELGEKPARPPVVTGQFDKATSSLRITAGLSAGKTVSWAVNISYPPASKTGGQTGPVPAIIAYGGLSIPRPDGAAVIKFDNSKVGVQNNRGSRGKGLFYDLYGANATAGALMAWAWGTSRIIDVIADNPQLNIDPTRIAITGCSRNGKGAMVAGAFDERIALTLPQESGAGGDACWRISRNMLVNQKLETQTASEIIGENAWFARAFGAFGAAANDNAALGLLPVDHHELAGVVAPRGLYSTGNTGFLWLGGPSSYDCMVTANTIFGALGVADRHGFSQDGGHEHCTFPKDQVPEITAFYQRFLFGRDGVNTKILRTTGKWTYNSTWAAWSVPSFVQGGAKGSSPKVAQKGAQIGGGTPTTVNRASSVMVPVGVLATLLAVVVGSLL